MPLEKNIEYCKKYLLDILFFVFLILNIYIFLSGGLQDKFIISIEKDSPDIVQLFFPVNGAYSEINSIRKNAKIGKNDYLVFDLPNYEFKNIRFDLGDKEGGTLIKKIEIKRFLSITTYQSQDLMDLITPIQMIKSIKKVDNGVLLLSSGNDTAINIAINNNNNYNNVIEYLVQTIFILIFSLELIIYSNKFIFKMEHALILIFVPFLAASLLALVFYPGFMSYDTLHALRGARNGVTDSMWPPMVSYLWRVIDGISTNPAAMHFSQIFLLLTSVYFVCVFFTKKVAASGIFLLVYLSVPVVLGTVAVIWKDVLMAAFFMAAYSLILATETAVSSKKFSLLMIFSIALIFIGMCVRHNAFAGAIPLIGYISWLFCKRNIILKKSVIFYTILLTVTLFGILFSGKVLLDRYALPNFERLPNSSSTFIQVVQALDIAGASKCENKNLFGEAAQNLSIDEIRASYDPRHVNLSAKLLSMIRVDSAIHKIWFDAFMNSPICIWSYKAEMTKYLLGANSGEQFIVTVPAIDKNEFGYHLADFEPRTSAVSYIVGMSGNFFFRPWFIYILALICFLKMLFQKKLTNKHYIFYGSGFLYFASLIAFGNAADARLPFYSTTVFIIFIFISMFAPKRAGS
jgi:hypothetical protein